jgi:hypothetical protein
MKFWEKLRVRVTLQLAVSQSVGVSWCRAPSGAHDQIFIYLFFVKVAVLSIWGALSDERSGLSLISQSLEVGHLSVFIIIIIIIIIIYLSAIWF